MEARRVVEAYRWQRALGNEVIATPRGRVAANRARPEVWDANHLDAVTEAIPAEADELLASADRPLSYTPWRVVHTDPATPDGFTARLALDGHAEQPATGRRTGNTASTWSGSGARRSPTAPRRRRRRARA